MKSKEKASKILRSSRILVAEDDILSQMVTSQMLENAGFTVDVVSDGHAILKILESNHYDVIVMDCFMPGMDGFTATRAIRKAENKLLDPDLPIIALTALAMKGDREKCLAAGMTDYLRKPVDSEELVNAVKSCLGIAHAKQSPVDGDNIGDPEALPEKDDSTLAGTAWDPAVLDEVLSQFFEQIPRYVAVLKAANEQGNHTTLQEVSHKIHGFAGMTGARELSGRALELYQVVQAGDSSKVAEHTENLIRELETLSRFME